MQKRQHSVMQTCITRFIRDDWVLILSKWNEINFGAKKYHVLHRNQSEVKIYLN